MFVPGRRSFLRAAAGAVAATAGLRAHAGESKDPLPRTKDYIVALVRSNGADPKLRPAQRIEPVEFPPDPKSSPDNALVFDHFVGDLHLRYVFEDPQFMLALRARDLKRLSIARDELSTLALANFKRLYPKLAVAWPDRWLGALGGGGELEPCALLDGPFWNAQAKAFNNEVIAVVPSTYEVYFAPRQPKQNIELLKHLAILHAEKAAKRAVSRTVFVWRFFRWEVLA